VNERLEKLRQKLSEQGLDAILISQPENRRYLSGFTGTTALVFISQRDAILATDFRYVEQAEAQAPHLQVVQIKGEFSHWFPDFISQFRVHRLGFESQGLCFAGYEELQKAIEGMSSDAQPQLIPSRGLVESLRLVKEQGDLELIEKAAALADAALEQVAFTAQPGITEKELAWGLEKFLRENGSEPLPFEVIVASGPNSALPHAQSTERPIGYGEAVVIDLGARFRGYCSDMTRTVCWGEPEQALSRIYEVVLEAQLAALQAVREGMSGAQADRLARAVIEGAGYSDAFGHGLGHGVGLAVHEEPYLNSNSTSILSQGMVFTIEPGIYIKGWGGVRIEDMVVLEKEGVRTLTKASKGLRR
jgi:Xaa-Pro aminopeptidase